MVVIAAVQHSFGTSKAGSPGRSASPNETFKEQSGGISYGATPKRVLATLGTPTTKQPSCWSYKANAHTVGRDYLGKFVDGLRYCFGDGPAGGKAVVGIYVHVIAHPTPADKNYPGGWEHAVAVIGSGTPAP